MTRKSLKKTLVHLYVVVWFFFNRWECKIYRLTIKSNENRKKQLGSFVVGKSAHCKIQ